VATKGPRRPRPIPQRTCVACRRTTAKRQLIRLVRTPEGRVEVDPTGKKGGRGAYLCNDRRCWERALGRGRLDRALRTRLTAAEVAVLKEFAATLVAVAPAS